MDGRIKILLLIIIFFSIGASMWYVLHDTILFHTDIARDFLVMEEMINTMKPTLIGPRSGGIPGVFHGPLWFYINLPAYIIGEGNPVIVGWFWVLLIGAAVLTTYYIGKKLTDKNTALISSALVSLALIPFSHSLFNPFGAVLLFPVFFYFLNRYLIEPSFKILLVASFLLGLMCQFQIAFGAPVALITFFIVLRAIGKNRKYRHILAFFALLLPMSTYILFDVRHDFLQFRSVISYLSTKQSVGELGIKDLLYQRVKGMLADGIQLTGKYTWLNIGVTSLFVWTFIKRKKKNADKYHQMFRLFFILYGGFWIITYAYKGVVWHYYYWPFLPVIAIMYSTLRNKVNKYLFAFLTVIILGVNIYTGVRAVRNTSTGWTVYRNDARMIYNDTKGEPFGYYIYTPDQFGYSERYAMNYVQKEYPHVKASGFQKQKVTYLLIAHAPEDKPYLNGDWWKSNQVKITREPDELIRTGSSTRIEKYILKDEELKVPSDPNILQDLTFR